MLHYSPSYCSTRASSSIINVIYHGILSFGSSSQLPMRFHISSCSLLHSSCLAFTHSSHNPFAAQSRSAIACSVSRGRQSPPFSSAGWITSGIHVSANTSVHVMWSAVATVKRMGVKCDMSSVRRFLHRCVSSGDRFGRMTSVSGGGRAGVAVDGIIPSGSSCSRSECVARV